MSGTVVIETIKKDDKCGCFKCMVMIDGEIHRSTICIDQDNVIKGIDAGNDLVEELERVNIPAMTQLCKLIFSLSKGEEIDLPITMPPCGLVPGSYENEG